MIGNKYSFDYETKYNKYIKGKYKIDFNFI